MPKMEVILSYLGSYSVRLQASYLLCTLAFNLVPPPFITALFTLFCYFTFAVCNLLAQ